MATDPTFEVTVPPDESPGETLLVGLSGLGMAGLTAADYLARHLGTREVGAVVADGLPAIAPFEDGVPRHHTRLYDVVDAPLAVLVGELFVPLRAARAFVDAVLDWTVDAGVEEVVVLHGVPYPHGPEEHAVYHVATPAYRDRRLVGDALPPLAGGVLDGAAGELVNRALDDGGRPVGVFVTPTHPPGPDVDAALLLVEAVEGVYGVDVDEGELAALAEQLDRYYGELADRMAALAEAEPPVAGRELPDDRMYM